MSETWIYPAPAWRAGERVEIDGEGHPYYEERGVVTGPAEWDDDSTWEVQLDSGQVVSAYAYELTGVYDDSASTGLSDHQEGEE